MAAEDKIDPLGPYRDMRPLKEGNVFAKIKIKRKFKKEKESKEEKLSEDKNSQDHKVDIEA